MFEQGRVLTVSADVLIVGGGALCALIYNGSSSLALKHVGRNLIGTGRAIKVTFVVLGGCLILMNYFASVLVLSFIQKQTVLSGNALDLAYFINLAAGGVGVFLGWRKRRRVE